MLYCTYTVYTLYLRSIWQPDTILLEFAVFSSELKT